MAKKNKAKETEAVELKEDFKEESHEDLEKEIDELEDTDESLEDIDEDDEDYFEDEECEEDDFEEDGYDEDADEYDEDEDEDEYDLGITKERVAEATSDFNTIYKEGAAAAKELKDAFDDIKSAFNLGGLFGK